MTSTGALDHRTLARRAGRDPRVEHILSVVRAAGGRITLSRRALVAVLVDSDSHVSAEELVERVQSRYPDMAESTVYRILANLEELGLVHHVQTDHGPARYHLRDEPHAHLVCARCGSIDEAPVSDFGPITDLLQARYGFALDSLHLGLTGLCAACAAADDSPET